MSPGTDFVKAAWTSKPLLESNFRLGMACIHVIAKMLQKCELETIKSKPNPHKSNCLGPAS